MNSGLAGKTVLLCCAALFYRVDAAPLGVPDKPTIIMVERAAGRTIYKVDSKPTGHVPTDDILYMLNHVAHRNGVDHPVLVYLDPSAPIDEIWNLNGIAAKAQLNNLRYFVFFRENQMMTEIKWTPFSPFTTSPPEN